MNGQKFFVGVRDWYDTERWLDLYFFIYFWNVSTSRSSSYHLFVVVLLVFVVHENERAKVRRIISKHQWIAVTRAQLALKRQVNAAKVNGRQGLTVQIVEHRVSDDNDGSLQNVRQQEYVKLF